MKITFRARTVIDVPALGLIAAVGLITPTLTPARMSHKFSTALRNTGAEADFVGYASLQGVDPASPANLHKTRASTRSPFARYEFCEKCGLGQDTSSHLLEEHVVVANRTEVPIGKVGSSIEILTSADLEPLKQSFLLEALRLVPGFYLRNNGGPGQVFGMTTRGLNTNRPVVLIDGIEVNNPASGEIMNFGTLFLSQIERVEILKGSNSTIYGADALAGVISISSKDGKGEPGSSLNLMAGSHDTVQVGAATWGESGDWNYRVAVSSYDSEGYSAQPVEFGMHGPTMISTETSMVRSISATTSVIPPPFTFWVITWTRRQSMIREIRTSYLESPLPITTP